EENIFAGGLEIVVRDVKGSRAVPTPNRLGLGPDLFEVGEIGPGDGDFPPVQRDAAPGALLGVAVKITAVEDDVVRQHFFGGFATVAQQNQVVGKGSGGRMEFAAANAKVMTAGVRRPNPSRIGPQIAPPP